MATLAQIADELSSSPAATTRLPAAELGLLVGEREHRLSAMVAARDQAVAELGLLDQRATSLLPVTELRLTAGAELTLKPSSELVLYSPAASVVLESGAALTLERDSALIVGEPNRGLSLLTQQIGASRLVGLEGLLAQAPEASRLLGLGSPFEPAATKLDGLIIKAPEASRLPGLGSPFEPGAAISSLVAGLGGRSMQEFALAMENYTQSTQAMARQFVENVSGLVGLPDVYQMADVLGARRSPAVHVTQAGVLVEIEPLTWPPAQRPGGEPPPHSGNFGIQPAQPGQPGGWQALLADALRAGQAQPDEVIRLVAQVAKLPPVAEIGAELAELEDLERAWQRVQRRQTAESFAASHGLSRATLYRRWARLKKLRLMLRAWQ